MAAFVSAVDNPLKAEWASQTGEALVIQPDPEFGAPKDIPVSAVAGEYEVESFPPDEAPAPVPEPRLKTAEQQFAEAAREAPKSDPVVEEPEVTLDDLGGREAEDAGNEPA